MDIYIYLRFIFGALLGSFFNVLAVRYDPDKFILAKTSLGGRSRCPHCARTLRWFELIPLVSFIIQAGRCRSCHARLSWQYPAAEIISGLLLATVPGRQGLAEILFHQPVAAGYLWYLVFAGLMILALIDLKTQLIPDEINIALGALGVIIAALTPNTTATYVGSYALLFGMQGNIYLNRLVGALAGALFFGGLIAITRGRGMGWGDFKLAVALGVIFGWPDGLIIVLLAFILGAIVSLLMMLAARARLKSLLPFGPFLALSALIVYFWGGQMFEFYFSLFAG